MGKAIDLTGLKFNRLTAMYPTEKRSSESVIWCCLCDCGNEVFVRATSLRAGHTQSCGCLSAFLTTQRFTTHGMTNTREYHARKDMIRRCRDFKHRDYKNYGGRGIKVCDRWLESFENFYEDMGPCPKGKSLDRWPNNDGDYEPRNTRYATPREQRVNSRPISCGIHKQRWFFAFNLNTGEWAENNNQAEFAREYGLSPANISGCLCKRRKIHKGWIFEFLT